MTPEEQEKVDARIQEIAEAKAARRQWLPTPNVPGAEDLHEIAKAISSQSSNNLVVRYIRSAPYLMKVNGTGTDQYKFARGYPIGCMVAFVHNGQARIGWAKRHSSLEDHNFTKDRARYCAVLRALTDGVTFTGKGKSAVTFSGEVIPGKVSKELGAFFQQAIKYIQADFHNVDTNV